MVLFRHLLVYRIALLLLPLLPASGQAAEAVSFSRDVMAVLSRTGCNQGACHGNLNGKGGLKFSLRGEDAEFDFRALTRDMSSRRVDPFHPEQSLFLRKAAGLVSHEGGVRFSADSQEYRILETWLKTGMKFDGGSLPKLTKVEVEPAKIILDETKDRFRIKAIATFADGTKRDVTTLSAFDSTNPTLVNIAGNGEVKRNQFGETVVLVRYLNITVAVPTVFLPERVHFKAVKTASPNIIDKQLYPQWASLKLQPSATVDDSAFVRRLYLDVLGRLPTSDEARKYLLEPSPDKRTLLIDILLRRPEFADYWALKWSDLLRNEEKSLDAKGVRVFHQWIRDAIQADKPLNEFAAELVSARGSTYKNPPANLYRALREPYARAESVAQVFMGVRLQCAKCHNHPFDVWTQEDYHRFAAVFAKIDYRVLTNNRGDDFDKHEFNGEQVVFLSPDKEVVSPKTGESMQARLIGTTKLLDAAADRTDELAKWMADPANPFFAKAQVNRVWHHLFGRGLVEPNDDFRLSNPPVNAELLNALSVQFRNDGFKLRSLMKLILTSETYQLSSIANETNVEDDIHFSKYTTQPLEAEQLADAIVQVTGSRMKFNGYPMGTRAGQMAAPLGGGTGKRKTAAMGEKFMKVFGKPERLLTCDCERSEDAGLLQSLQMINGDVVQKLISSEGNMIGKLIQAKASDETVVEEIFLAAYSRFPNDTEKSALHTVLKTAKDRRIAIEDIMWGVLNSKEFLIRR